MFLVISRERVRKREREREKAGGQTAPTKMFASLKFRDKTVVPTDQCGTELYVPFYSKFYC